MQPEKIYSYLNKGIDEVLEHKDNFKIVTVDLIKRLNALLKKTESDMLLVDNKFEGE